MFQHLQSSTFNVVQKFKYVNSNLESLMKPKLWSLFKAQLEFVTFLFFVTVCHGFAFSLCFCKTATIPH